jgi:hypothetical protein
MLLLLHITVDERRAPFGYDYALFSKSRKACKTPSAAQPRSLSPAPEERLPACGRPAGYFLYIQLFFLVHSHSNRQATHYGAAGLINRVRLLLSLLSTVKGSIS